MFFQMLFYSPLDLPCLLAASFIWVQDSVFSSDNKPLDRSP
jgi:hypothetical protein